MRLVIRKVQFAPVSTGPAPKSETTKQFMLSDKPLHLEATLDKEVCVMPGHLQLFSKNVPVPWCFALCLCSAVALSLAVDCVQWL